MDSLRPCPACGQSLSADAEFCPHCGKPFRKRHSVFYYVCAVVGSLIVLGIIGAVLYGILVVAPAAATARRAAQRNECERNLRSIWMAFESWKLDQKELNYPFCVSTNKGGTLELCCRDTNGVDLNSLAHFLRVTNGFYHCGQLVCPTNHTRWRSDWTNFTQADVTYHLHTARHEHSSPDGILAYCPEHRLALRCDGSVHSCYKAEDEEEISALAEDQKAQAAKAQAEKDEAARQATAEAEDKAREAERRAKHEASMAEIEARYARDISRTWTYKTGLTVEGKFVSFQQPGRIVVRKDMGYDSNFNPQFQDYSLEIEKLSETDQRIAAQLAESR